MEGVVTLGSGVPNREGVRIFISRYAREWVHWHRAGGKDRALCDLAAFRAAAIHAYYLDKAPWSETLTWLVAAFGISEKSNFLDSPLELSAATRAILRRMRPEAGSTAKAGEEEAPGDGESWRELLKLACPVEHVLVQGGDNRLTLNPETLLNGYGCRPFPRPEAITFSSSTASSISTFAYGVADRYREALIVEALRDGIGPTLEKFAQRIRRDIVKQICGGREIADVVLCSSGTDCFLIAQGLVRLTSDQPLVTLIVGANESGTGVPLAAQERHFSVKAALGEEVERGKPVHDQAQDGAIFEVALRDEEGRAVSAAAVDRGVRRLAERHLAGGAKVLIHAMNHSKLGASGPSLALLLDLKTRFGDRVQVIVDACQMRLELEEIRDYLIRDFPVIITGSKFFTGPPLSGAVLVSRPMAARIQARRRSFPEGFNAYCASFDFPAELRTILVKPSSNYNLGSYFRWVAAIAEMKRYFAVPAPWRKRGLDQFCREIRKLFRGHDAIQLQDETMISEVGKRPGREFAGRRMIFPFFLVRRRVGGAQLCDAAEIRKIYELLNQDCSQQFETSNAREYRLLAQRCHIGQPVKAVHPCGETSAVLRLSVGARVISESWSEASGRIEPDLVQDEIWQVGVVLDKITLLLKKLGEARAATSVLKKGIESGTA
jgi:hypothetical protein